MSRLEETWYDALNGEMAQYESFVTLKGDPWNVLVDAEWLVCPRCGEVNNHSSLRDWSEEHSAIGCNSCDFAENSTGPDVLAPTTTYKGLVLIPNTSVPAFQARMKELVTAARSARFEHGEKPGKHRFQFGTSE